MPGPARPTVLRRKWLSGQGRAAGGEGPTAWGRGRERAFPAAGFVSGTCGGPDGSPAVRGQWLPPRG